MEVIGRKYLRKMIFDFIRMIKSSSPDEKRLVDDAFIKICNMINDGSMMVRAEATGLLGSLHLVSFIYLEQTLDKKLMSHLRVSYYFHTILKTSAD